MPNLDAEVLNEPKKQIVKDFSKEEIVQIIQNAIDKGIINLGDIGGSEVTANPTLEGTEPNLEGLEVDGEKYKIPEGTMVEANPTLVGTESPLIGLQVGNVKYKVGGGTKLYLHKITSMGGNKREIVLNGTDNTITLSSTSASLTLIFISTSDTKYTTTYLIAKEIFTGKVFGVYISPYSYFSNVIPASAKDTNIFEAVESPIYSSSNNTSTFTTYRISSATILSSNYTITEITND